LLALDAFPRIDGQPRLVFDGAEHERQKVHVLVERIGTPALGGQPCCEWALSWRA
jgi:hypothetical protein